MAVYHQLLRGPWRRWWRPPVALLLLVAVLGDLLALSSFPVIGYALLIGADPGRVLENASSGRMAGPESFLLVNLSIIAFWPAAVLSIWAVHRIRPGYLSSVAGRLRWSWLGRVVLIVVPVWAAYFAVNLLIGLGADGPTDRPAQWPVLLVMVLLLTPLQAAAEEYLFRGWLPQNLGMYFRSERLGLIVSSLVPAAAFALGHGSLDPWILADLLTFAVAAHMLAWRTGGLEAGIVLHAVNNVGIFGLTLGFGGWEESFIGAMTTGSPLGYAVSLIFTATVVLLVWRRTARTGLIRRYQPVTATGR